MTKPNGRTMPKPTAMVRKMRSPIFMGMTVRCWRRSAEAYYRKLPHRQFIARSPELMAGGGTRT